MDEQQLREAQRRAEEAREAWKRARSELKEAFKEARHERKRAQAESASYRDEMDESIQGLVDAAREVAFEIGGEAKRLADDLMSTAQHDLPGRWRESFGKDWRDHWVLGGRRFRQRATGGDETNPFVAAILSRGGGLLAVYVLHLLAEKPRHGNDVMRQIEQRTMGSWSSNPGAIYPLLGLMEEKQLVQSQWEDPDKRSRRIYQITDLGRMELERLRRALRPKVMESIEVLHAMYEEIYGGDGKPSETASFDASAPPTSPDDSATPGPNPEDHLTQLRDESGEEGWRQRLGRLLRGGPDQAVALGG